MIATKGTTSEELTPLPAPEDTTEDRACLEIDSPLERTLLGIDFACFSMVFGLSRSERCQEAGRSARSLLQARSRALIQDLEDEALEEAARREVEGRADAESARLLEAHDTY